MNVLFIGFLGMLMARKRLGLNSRKGLETVMEPLKDSFILNGKSLDLFTYIKTIYIIFSALLVMGN